MATRESKTRAAGSERSVLKEKKNEPDWSSSFPLVYRRYPR